MEPAWEPGEGESHVKRKLRHPVRAIREPFGTAGLIVAVIALIAALAGGAYAAGGLTGKQKKEVTKIAKKYAGKPGATGPAGPAGPAGANGKDGANGQDGAAGSNGVSVTSQAATAGECSAGGTKFTSASGSGAVCNGKNGTTGFTEILPSGKTETGVWSIGSIERNAAIDKNKLGIPFDGVYAPISFPIPLEVGLTADQVHYINPDGQEVEWAEQGGSFTGKPVDQPTPKPCPGTAADPQAEQGELCVYQASLEGAFITSQLIGPADSLSLPSPFFGGTGRSGALMTAAIMPTSEARITGWGTWAVTAP
jgi:hypothetical protein